MLTTVGASTVTATLTVGLFDHSVFSPYLQHFKHISHRRAEEEKEESKRNGGFSLSLEETHVCQNHDLRTYYRKQAYE